MHRYLDFIDALLSGEMDAKQRKRVAIQIAHFPVAKTLDDFDFKAHPSLDQRWVKELTTGRNVAQAKNVLLFGQRRRQDAPRPHARPPRRQEGHSVLFVSATTRLAALAKAESEGQLEDKLNSFEKRSAHLFFQLIAQWGGVFGDDVLAAAILDRVLHHSRALIIRGESRTDEGPPAPTLAPVAC